MRSIALALILFTTLTFAAPEPCTENIQYKSGIPLKRGDQYYYNSGNTLLRDPYIYYSTGTYLKRNNDFYYPNGTNLLRGTYLYYPTGSYLKRGDTYYYANGSYLKHYDMYYYSNGMPARRNGKLYRPDGTETPFPIYLNESIENYGEINASVRSTSDQIDVRFHQLLLQNQDVELLTTWNGQTFSTLAFYVKTGHPGEEVLIKVSGAEVTCELIAFDPQKPSQFMLEGKAANVSVRVKPGFDPMQVRSILERALNSIGR